MKTALLMSVIVATFLLPMIASRARNAANGLRGMVVAFSFFVVVYYLWVAYGHTRFFVPD